MLDRSSCFHGYILLLWIIRHLEVMCILDMNRDNPILPVPLRLWSQKMFSNDSLHGTCIGAQSDQSQIIWEIFDWTEVG